MARVCMTCGNPQGPFDRLLVGTVHTTKAYIFTCPIPTKDADGRRLPDNKRQEAAAACNNRREKRATAQENNPIAG